MNFCGRNKAVYIYVLLIFILLLDAPVAMGMGKGTGISGSPHDFSTKTWNREKHICIVCHVPHDYSHVSERYENGLSWNHELSSARYSMYGNNWSSTMDGFVSSAPGGTSKLCLSCHDGTVALDSYANHSGGSQYIPDPFRISKEYDGSRIDLRGTHPISVAYDVNADPGLNDPNTTDMGTSGKIRDILDNGRVQCSSCHDVHDQESVPSTALLRVGTRGDRGTPSELCFVCHNM